MLYMKYIAMIVDEDGKGLKLVAAADDESKIRSKLDELYVDKILLSEEYSDKKLALYEVSQNEENNTSDYKLLWISE